ncbi:hypothetical protein DERP_005066 [Dermatophagoides pteronyssinus]|uniref:Tubby-related protein 4-like n=1 Tax=Dermatophagoides pteronyssinus TaxID=6956 RepID=A0ABQ8JUD3_DERPT|nr:hypothetical protein DERP_005066 [Dermatophagoides pteronyssinus]
MFIRFEPIKRPQSYNDNPITSLSWMINDCSQNLNNNNNVTSTNNENDDNSHHNNIIDDNDQQQQQQQQPPESSYSIDNHHPPPQRNNSLSFSSNERYYPSFDDDDNNNNNNSGNGQNMDEILDGWLAIGNCGGVVGVTYTTIDSLHIQNFKRQINNNGDQTINKSTNFMTSNHTSFDDNNSRNQSAIVPQRTNFNLRGHRSEIVFVRWNEPYQKLASCDRNGVIFVWIKYEGRWSIELINDRNTRVTDFAWSHDGRMALICYMDGFVLVGSVSGQRYWSSMLNLNGCSITCGTWTANNQHVLFGTSNGHLLVISVHGVFITQISIQEGVEIASMMWSCQKFQSSTKQRQQQNNDSILADLNNNHRHQQSNETVTEEQHENHMLAISFVDGTIYLMQNYDEVFPTVIETSLINIKMEWSMNGKLLAIGGHRIIKSSVNGMYMYHNIVRIYRHDGTLIRQCQLDFNYQPLSALTWACNDRRLFIACGQLLYVAWIIHGIPSLSFISGLQVYNGLKDEINIERLQVPESVKLLLSELFTSTIHCYLPDYQQIGKFVFRPPANNLRLHCTLMRHETTTTSTTTALSSSSLSMINHNHYQQQQQLDSSIINQSSSNNDDTFYILYLEYLGGLVPILKGKRSSKIKPEFIIFDPQRNLDSNTKISSNASNLISDNNFNSQKISNTTDTFPNGGRFKYFLQNSVWTSVSGNRNLTSTTTTTSDSENDNDNSSSTSASILYHLTPKTRRRLRYCRTPQFGSRHRHYNDDDNNNNLEHQQPPNQTPWINDNTLPETDKIVLITSNIWGTKFKFLGMSPKLPTNLGSITYRTSLLHLQPRQMSLVIKELNDKNTFTSNYNNNHHHNIIRHKHYRNNEQQLNKNNSFNGNYYYSSDSEDEFSESQRWMMQNSSSNDQSSSSSLMIPPIAPLSTLKSQQVIMLKLSHHHHHHSTTTTTNHNNIINHRPSIVSIDSPPPTSSSSAISSTFVRQFKHQTFQSESPKHVSSFSQRLSQQQQQQQQQQQSQVSTSGISSSSSTTTTTTQQQSSSQSPKLYSSPNISPNKQIIRSKILMKESSPRKSSVSYCSNEFTKKSFVGCMMNETETSTICDIVETTIGAPSSGINNNSRCQNGHHNHDDDYCNNNDTITSSTTYLVKYKTCINESLALASTVDSNTTTIPAASLADHNHNHHHHSSVGNHSIRNNNNNNHNNNNNNNHHQTKSHHHHHHHHRSQSFQTYHIYDDTDRVIVKANPLNLDDSNSKQQRQSNQMVDDNNDDDNDDDSTDQYIRNVEQVVQSLSKKLQQQQQQQSNNQKNQIDQNQYQQQYDQFTNLNQQQQQQHLFRNNSLSYDDDDNDRSSSSLSSTTQLHQTPRRFVNSMIGDHNNRNRRNMSITSLVSLPQQQQQQQQSNPMDRLRSIMTTSNQNTNNLLINKNRSLPSSPLMGMNRKELNPLPSNSSKVQSSRRSNGRHFFHSPKVVRKLRRKLSYLDCSSEDDENNTSDDDDDLNSIENQSTLIMDQNADDLNNNNNNNQSKIIEKKRNVHQKCRKFSNNNNNENETSKKFILHNKAPLWNEISQVYQLDFGGRVTQESAKNFQIEYQGRQVMQFGRIDTNAYTLDFEYPFSAVQAMAVALANVTQRLK